MLIDHTRDYTRASGVLYDPANVETTTPILFFTRWLTLTSRIARMFVTFGRVPMFFYILQWISSRVFGLLVAAAYHREFSYFFSTPFDNIPNITAFGGPLWLTCVCWLAGAVLIWLPCRWYAALKARRKDLTLLRYL